MCVKRNLVNTEISLRIKLHPKILRTDKWSKKPVHVVTWIGNFGFSRRPCRLVRDDVILKLCACVTLSPTSTALFQNAATVGLTFTQKPERRSRS